MFSQVLSQFLLLVLLFIGLVLVQRIAFLYKSIDTVTIPQNQRGPYFFTYKGVLIIYVRGYSVANFRIQKILDIIHTHTYVHTHTHLYIYMIISAGSVFTSQCHSFLDLKVPCELLFLVLRQWFLRNNGPSDFYFQSSITQDYYNQDNDIVGPLFPPHR